ncbi:putative poly ADP-ribose polymerase 3 [Nymphaea thermarum]|nr:putative poly ADP-ribose polymerase 3 [Nymphaea thermarum]
MALVVSALNHLRFLLQGPETRSHTRGAAAEEDTKVGARKQKGHEPESGQQLKRTRGRSSAEIAAEFGEFCKAARQHLSVEQMKKILEASDQNPTGSDDAVVPRCEDVMFYGPLKRCPLCNGWMECTGKEYKCTGTYSEWGSCIFTTKEDQRKPEPLKLPDGLELDPTAKQWFDNQDPAQRPQRDLSADQGKLLSGMVIALSGRMTRKHVSATALHHGSIKSPITWILCACSSMSFRVHVSAGIVACCSYCQLEMGIPVVSESWMIDSLQKKEQQPLEAYDVASDLAPEGRGIAWDKQEPSEEALESLATELKVYGKRGVHKDSRLQERGGYILEKDGLIYNCALTKCDIARDINEYCIMQLIMVPKDHLYMYYKRGRPGDDPKAEERLEERTTVYSRRRVITNIVDDAIKEFANLFQELTGNEFEPWEREKKINKQFNKFFPVDVDDGMDVRHGGLGLRQLGVAALHTKLDPFVANLMKVLCSQLVYKYAVMEMGYDVPDLPSGMLTDLHLHRCEEALREFLEKLNAAESSQRKQALWSEFSNKWFTLMHSSRPFIIRDLHELADHGASALESMRDIKVASLIVGDMTGATVDDPLYERFTKLGCSISPLDKNSEDYQMIVKYLDTTYEPFRLEDVSYGVSVDNIFKVQSSACPSLDDLKKMPNKVLLWCGTRTSNLLRHLQMGFLPALCTLPVPGYMVSLQTLTKCPYCFITYDSEFYAQRSMMFGEAIICSDASAEAAKYGFTAVDRPDGFLVLAVVALGDKIVEISSIPGDTKSLKEQKVGVKGLGKKKPDEAGHFKWNSDVLVPCGRLIPSGKDDSPLEYNEYAVYDPKQVSIRYLVGVKYEEMNMELVPDAPIPEE